MIPKPSEINPWADSLLDPVQGDRGSRHTKATPAEGSEAMGLGLLTSALYTAQLHAPDLPLIPKSTP